MFQCVNGTAPGYLSSDVRRVADLPGRKHLCSAASSFLAIPAITSQPPLSLREPHYGTSSSISYSPVPSPITSSSSYSPLCLSITPSLIHSRLKTYLFHKSDPRNFTSSSRTAFTDFCPHRFFSATRFLCSVFSYFFRFCAVR